MTKIESSIRIPLTICREIGKSVRLKIFNKASILFELKCSHLNILFLYEVARERGTGQGQVYNTSGKV